MEGMEGLELNLMKRRNATNCIHYLMLKQIKKRDMKDQVVLHQTVINHWEELEEELFGSQLLIE